MSCVKILLYIAFCFIAFPSFGQASDIQLLEKYSTSIICCKREAKGAVNEALKCAQEALAIAKLLDDDRKTLESLYYITRSLKNLGQYQAAFEYAYEGLGFSDEVEDFFVKARFESLCGSLYLLLNKPDDALVYLENALGYYKLTDNTAIAYITLGNITNAYSMKSDYAKAKPILKEIKRHYRSEKDTINYITTVLNLADLYKNTKEIDSALYEISSLKEYSLNTKFSINTFLLKGEIYNETEEFDRAIFNLEKANEIAGTINDIWLEESITKTLALSYSNKEDYKNASFFYKRNAQLKDSILSVKAQERLQELETLYQVSKKEKEIEQLLKTKEQRNRQITWLIVLTLFILLILLLVYFKTKAKIKYAHLTNEMLSQELKHKKNELTNFAVHYSEVNKLMRTVQLKANSLNKIEDPHKVKTKISELINEFGLSGSLIKNHKNIESYIDTSYSDFMFALENLSSELTNKEKRICSLILVNCSSKEIADILSISPKSINNSRSTIRKKLNISEKENMNGFFNKLIS